MRDNELDEIDLDEVAGWLIQTEQYKRKPISLHQQCKLDLARALKDERFTDENGNEIRRNHAIRIKDKDSPKQMVFWVDIKTAKPKPMRLSLQQRRLAILADCYRHSLDTEWYNENNKAELPLFDYDFNKDLEEKKLPTDYPEENPED